jgi:hypothetical protein
MLASKPVTTSSVRPSRRHQRRHAPRRPLPQFDDLIKDRFHLSPNAGAEATEELLTSLRWRDAAGGAGEELREAPLLGNGEERRQHIQVVELQW